ncbi:MAG: desulfoferrodoxin [bacterium]|nr:desulfoferrodoxin [bacterium]
MAKQFEIYKCEICGNIIEVLFGAAGELVCCGEPMTLMIEKTQEEMHEKHLPVLEKGLSGDVIVKVGEVPHPMTKEHYIQMIEVFTKDGILERKYLFPSQKPEFLIKLNQGITHAREYCNIHGLWMKGENNVI